MTPRLLATFPALQHRNFRLLWIGLLVSFTGSFMQTAALLWHVSLLVPPDKKGLALGLVGLVRILPIVFFSLMSGVVADASDRRRVMLVTQTTATLVAATLAFLAFHGLKTVWPLYVLAALGGAAAAFDLPARQALLPMLVPREHLPNAISLNTTMAQTAAVLGPALGGLLIGAAHVGWAYALNAVSFLFVIGALLLMRDVQTRAPAHPDAMHGVSLRSALDGLRFVFRAPLIRSTMLLDFFATFFSSATALLPMFAQDILHVGARGYGWLYAAPAAGAVITSVIMVGAVERIERRGATLLWGVVVYGAATVVFGLSRSFLLTFLCLAATGAADTVSMVIRNVTRQLQTPDHLRGRMTGVNMVFFMGGPQLGELEAGLMAQWMGAPFSVVSGGVGCLIAVAWVAAATPMLRHYRRSTAEAPLAGGSVATPAMRRR
ncbi:MAG: MFS transporter [bacterium]